MASYLSGLLAAFDGQALQAPGVGQAPFDVAARQLLEAWCHRGAGPGGAPLWRPGAMPAIAQRLAVAVLAAAAPAQAQALAEALALEIDGTQRLLALPGRAAGLAWRLQVKLADAAWWRQRQASDPWDAGWALATEAGSRHLAQRFEPRRATLVLASAAQAAVLAPALAALQQRSAALRHPLRWLWVGTPAACQGLPAQARFSA